MAKYLLDTNIPIYLGIVESPFHNHVKKNFQRLHDDDQLFVSVLSLYELHYGLSLRKKEEQNQSAARTHMIIEEIKTQFTILPLREREAPIFGEIKAAYKSKYNKEDGKKESVKKHDVDFIFAGTAIEYGFIVVSNDGIFQRIKELFPNLRVENWATS